MAAASSSTGNVEPLDASPSKSTSDAAAQHESPSVVPVSSSPAYAAIDRCDSSNSSPASQRDSEIQVRHIMPL